MNKPPKSPLEQQRRNIQGYSPEKRAAKRSARAIELGGVGTYVRMKSRPNIIYKIDTVLDTGWVQLETIQTQRKSKTSYLVLGDPLRLERTEIPPEDVPPPFVAPSLTESIEPKKIKPQKKESAPNIEFSKLLETRGFRRLLDAEGKPITSDLIPIPSGQFNIYLHFPHPSVTRFVAVVCDENGGLWTKLDKRSDRYVDLADVKGFKRNSRDYKAWSSTPLTLKDLIPK